MAFPWTVYLIGATDEFLRFENNLIDTIGFEGSRNMIEALELCISAMRSLMEDEEDTPELTETQNDESSDEQEDEQMDHLMIKQEVKEEESDVTQEAVMKEEPDVKQEPVKKEDPDVEQEDVEMEIPDVEQEAVQVQAAQSTPRPWSSYSREVQEGAVVLLDWQAYTDDEIRAIMNFHWTRDTSGRFAGFIARLM